MLSYRQSPFYKIPRSDVVARYVKSSHQNDPGRTVLEILLALFAIRTLLQSSRADNGEKYFIRFSEKVGPPIFSPLAHANLHSTRQEVDEDEWTPEPLVAPLTPKEQTDLAPVPVVSGANGPRPKLANTGKHVLNLASYNFTGLADNENIEVRVIETVRKFGVGNCGPSGFYGIIGASLCCECALSVTNGFGLQISTWTLSATWQTSSVQKPRFSTPRASRQYLA